jgi:hypothetical protein
MMRFLTIIPEILYELKAHSTLADIRRFQIQIREEIEQVGSGISGLQASLDIEIGPRLQHISNNSDLIPYEGGPTAIGVPE